MTLRDALTALSPTVAPRDAELLAAHLLHRDRTWLLAHPETVLTDQQQDQLNTLAARRAAHEPLQYILGEQEFYGLTLTVTPATLIPRPETELLVESVLSWLTDNPLPHAPQILDIGTGTGAIAIALAHHHPTARLTAVDLSPEALIVARQNAIHHNLDTRITFAESDLLAALSNAHFDVIVSNPPYVPTTDAPTLQPEVLHHEPHTALFAGPDGMDIYRRLIPQAHAALNPNGLLALEFGFGQRDALTALLHDWQNVRFLNDYANIPRIALAENAAR
jgi:release factor glutamine methyltransferase